MSPSSETRPIVFHRAGRFIAPALLLLEVIWFQGAAAVSCDTAALAGSRLGLSRAVLVRGPDCHALLLAEPRPGLR